jgi:hypothetical protein
LKLAALFSLDAMCCTTCCCFCGGCCGRMGPFVERVTLAGEKLKPGIETCQATCATQGIASIVVPFTCCLCCWGCCGTATSCAKGVAGCVMRVETDANVVAVAPAPVVVQMAR